MISPVLRKELRIELRSRYGTSAVVMFLVVTVVTIAFAAVDKISPAFMSAFFWITLFFGTITGLSRSFISEEERGTGLLLRLYGKSDAVFWGKFTYNLLLSLALGFTAVIIFAFFFKEFELKDAGFFFLQLLLGLTGTAAIVTILSALVARAAQKGALLPVLALPLLFPLVIGVTDATRITMEVPNAWEGVRGDILVLFSFDVALILVSYVLFEYVWQD